MNEGEGTCEIPDSGCGRSFGLEPIRSSDSVLRTPFFGLRSSDSALRTPLFGLRSSEWILPQPLSVGERRGGNLRDSGFRMRKILRTRGLEPIRNPEFALRSGCFPSLRGGFEPLDSGGRIPGSRAVSARSRRWVAAFVLRSSLFGLFPSAEPGGTAVIGGRTSSAEPGPVPRPARKSMAAEGCNKPL